MEEVRNRRGRRIDGDGGKKGGRGSVRGGCGQGTKKAGWSEGGQDTNNGHKWQTLRSRRKRKRQKAKAWSAGPDQQVEKQMRAPGGMMKVTRGAQGKKSESSPLPVGANSNQQGRDDW
ncbi:uncharacterized protein SPSK_03730 [Sporothrix schenckii 1099-18]|uniref:Uncharacterized protein n=1 Tax=Sporothrix schenckii 1099-18 TaxID=1397361 RepID=A0A0F2LYT0_SPOSC|nr:uncharacterized protein SPSK_03730 [Sporothrix schenckii 1099-18]KJR82627.1 hypothetical protein SPSK_03730 [Sporothrix schenckii 1099-18]